METTKKNHSVRVGAFISIGLLLFVAAIFVLGGQQKTFIKTITVKAVFNDINGLQAGNNIWLFGVKVGTVRKVNFYGPSQVEITMGIEKEAQSRIHKDASAKISTDGFIGNKIILLNGGTVNLPPVEEGDYIHVTIVTGTDQLFDTLQENNRNLLEITKNIRIISKKMANGEGTLGALLNDSAMAGNIKMAINHFKNVAAKSENVIADLQHFATGLHKKGGLANELITDTAVFISIRSSIDQLRIASETMNHASQKVYEIAGSLQNSAANLNNNKKPIGMLLNDEPLAQQLKTTITNLESSSKKLDEDLEAVRHNFLLKGYFKKMDKEKKQ